MRDRVIIVGSGMMGSGIGAMAALSGHKTILVDVDEKKVNTGLEKAKACIKLRADNGLSSREDSDKAFENLETSVDVESVADDTFIVIEAVVEDIEVKKEVFRHLDSILPVDVPICSNTSGLRITDISSLCVHPERTITTHFWLPAHLVPLVEVVMGDKTDEQIAYKVRDELKKWNKQPVIVKRDLPGQLANRVFQAIIRESVDIVENGLASAEDVDTAIAAGMAMRFPVWGPLKHLDAIGIDLGFSVQESVLPSIASNKEASQLLIDMSQHGGLGVKTGKGFYNWSERSINEDIERRDRFIIETVKILERIK